MYVRTGLGQQKVYGEVAAVASTTAAGVAAATSAGLLTAAGVVAAIPIIGGIVAGVAVLLSLFHVGEGCGNACVVAAATQQIFDAAMLNVVLAGKAGMITKAQAVAAIDWLKEQGDYSLKALAQTDKHAVPAMQEVDKATGIHLSEIESGNIPVDAPTAALDADKLQMSIFIQPGTHGWYGPSVSQGASLALQAIAEATNLAAQVQSVASATPASASADLVSKAESLLGGFSKEQIVIGLAVLAGGLYLATRGRRAS